MKFKNSILPKLIINNCFWTLKTIKLFSFSFYYQHQFYIAECESPTAVRWTDSSRAPLNFKRLLFLHKNDFSINIKIFSLKMILFYLYIFFSFTYMYKRLRKVFIQIGKYSGIYFLLHMCYSFLIFTRIIFFILSQIRPIRQ